MSVDGAKSRLEIEAENEAREVGRMENARPALVRDAKAPSRPPQVLDAGDAALRVAASDSEGRPRKQSDVLVDIGQEHTLFRDPGGIAYALVQVQDHAEVHPVESSAYREVLAERFLAIVGKGCNRNAMGDAIVTLASVARFRGETKKVWTRIAGSDAPDRVYVDMGRADWKCIEIDASGWRWCTSPPMLRRAGAPLPLPNPAAPDFARLWKYANVCIEHRPLLAAFMLSGLRPLGPYPQLHLSGEQGTGKSTLARVVKAVLDPSASPLRAPPKEVRDLLVGALNGWCLALDNLSFLTPQLSDALCRLSTGGAISERQLYTNADEVLIEVQRPVILNGIEDLAVRPDLAERGLHIELEVIEHRMSEAAFWAGFMVDAPHIFGALVAGVSLAIRDHRTVDIGRLPRMADFAMWAAAGIPALGFSADEFMESYRANIEEGMSAGIDGSPVGREIIAMIQGKGSWQGTAADLLTALSSSAGDAATRSLSWPKTPRGLSGVLRRLSPSLRIQGISVETGRDPNRTRARRIQLCNVVKQPSTPSTSLTPRVFSDELDGVDSQNRGLHDAEVLDL